MGMQAIGREMQFMQQSARKGKIAQGSFVVGKRGYVLPLARRRTWPSAMVAGVRMSTQSPLALRSGRRVPGARRAGEKTTAR